MSIQPRILSSLGTTRNALLILTKPSQKPTSRIFTHRSYSTETSQILQTDIPAPNSGRIRILSLNRPSARNAISRSLLHELRSHIDAIAAEYGPNGAELPPVRRYGGAAGVDEKGPVRVLILSSSVDSSFCAGADLKERATFSQDETATFLANLRNTFTALSLLPIPTISAISSTALGGGLELALCTHLRVLASTALVGLPETRLGIIPGAGGTYRLPALIGLSRARDLILTGRRVSAPEAYFLGIADRLVEVLPASEDESKEELMKRAGELTLKEAINVAGDICQGGPVAIRASLEAVGWAREEVENRCYNRVVATEDRDEALKAFKEKRRPVFKGK